MNMSNERQNCGSTHLHLTQKILTWEIKGAEFLFQEKTLPAWIIRSASFSNGDGHQRQWHLELREVRPDMLKCHLVAEPTESESDQPDVPGGVVNCVSVFMNDGRLERFSDIQNKHDESNGWTEWAQKFAEKRRKDGITEYLFGRDSGTYDNAVPVSYLRANREKYLNAEGTLRLNAELFFTKTTTTCADPEAADDDDDMGRLIQSQVQKNNMALLQRLADIGRSGECADLVVQCEDREFKLDRVVVQARLPSLLDHLIKTSTATESRSFESRSTSTNELGCGEVGLTLNAVLEKTEAALGPKIEMTPTGGEMGGASTMTSSLPTNERRAYWKLPDVSVGVMAVLVEYVYTGSLLQNIDVLTLTQVATAATKFGCGDLSYLCVLKGLQMFSIASDENKVVVAEALKEIFRKTSIETFENRESSISDLKKMYPGAFLIIGTFDC